MTKKKKKKHTPPPHRTREKTTHPPIATPDCPIARMPRCGVVFSLYEDAPAEWLDAWKTMVKSIASRKHNEAWNGIHKAISRSVKASAALHKNDAEILIRSEGGFGGHSNDFDRQIRFLNSYDGCSKAMLIMSPMDGSIALPPGHPEAADHKMEWTIPDLIEFKYAAAMGLNEYLYAVANPGAPTGELCIHAEISFSGLGFNLLASPEDEKSRIDDWVNKKGKRAPPEDDFSSVFFRSFKEIEIAIFEKYLEEQRARKERRVR